MHFCLNALAQTGMLAVIGMFWRAMACLLLWRFGRPSNGWVAKAAAASGLR